MYNFLGLSVFTFQICLTLMFPDFCVEDQVIISFFNPFFLFCIAAPQVQPKIQIILHAVGGALLCLLPCLHRHLCHDVWLLFWILQTVNIRFQKLYIQLLFISISIYIYIDQYQIRQKLYVQCLQWSSTDQQARNAQISAKLFMVGQGSSRFCKLLKDKDNAIPLVLPGQFDEAYRLPSDALFLLDKELIDSMQSRQQFWSFKTRRYFVVEYFAQLRPIEGRHKQRPQLHSSEKLLHLRRRSRVSLLFILLASREQFIKDVLRGNATFYPSLIISKINGIPCECVLGITCLTRKH